MSAPPWTLSELRARALAAMMITPGMVSDSGVIWITLRCPSCGLHRAFAALYRGRVHPWECQSCRRVIATPSPLCDAWHSATHLSTADWAKTWKVILDQYAHEGA